VELSECSRAREILNYATGKARSLKRPAVEIALHTVARMYGLLADIEAVHELTRDFSAMGRVRTLASVAGVMYRRNQQAGAAAGLLLEAFEATATLDDRQRQRAVNQLAPLCFELTDLPLSPKQQARMESRTRHLLS